MLKNKNIKIGFALFFSIMLATILSINFISSNDRVLSRNNNTSDIEQLALIDGAEELEKIGDRYYFRGVGAGERPTISGSDLGELNNVEIDSIKVFVLDSYGVTHELEVDEGNDYNLLYSIQVASWSGGFAVQFNSDINGDSYKSFVIYDFIMDQDSELYFTYKPRTDFTRPAISGNEHFATNIDSPQPIEYFVSQFKAYDDVDGDITELIKIENDNYSDNKYVLGEYKVTLSVTDSADNKSTFIFSIHVSDVTSPLVNGDFGNKVISYDKTYDLDTFVKTLIITDNVDSLENATITIVKTIDKYSTNPSQIGKHLVSWEISDSSDNKTKISITIEVKDLVKPVFQGIKSLTKSYTSVMSVADIIKDITANDEKDGKLEIKIESDNYSGNANKIGNFTLVLSATDKSGNKTLHEIEIIVIDDQNPNWFITNGVTINLSHDTPLTRQQIITLLSKAGQVNISANSIITYQTDTYSDNVGVVGIYSLAFNVTEPNGNSKQYTYAVNVMSESNEDTDVIPPNLTITEKITKFWKDNWITIVVVGVVGIGVLAVIVKVKEQIKKNKRKKRK